ncbi:3-deoxy-D-manno-octulosonic acid kinase [Marinobacter salarius]|jgi:3-deoxy-D-manno-octulosonic acid kinase|uniref:3-deoxy-D-manno-octulosonic acid kinase n=2 Tax=Marinobacter salarius TaxID=1420917 RepID=UPI000F850428|nr:3-deoxy-D-manno-octulosonic acid kinase [Marinobacter salarius]AZR40368.1 3-deoxy-D-manno-octulosonic acid kinase [Marinobacter salarius]VVT28907.1 3-deoxy-D-manno-octulosonic acid kinase [Marinobacter salarius]VXB23516.1 3-deoxy-D-manno-octulosonic acid kinase [Marinobacter salarius]
MWSRAGLVGKLSAILAYWAFNVFTRKPMVCRAEGNDLLTLATGTHSDSGTSLLLVSPRYEGVTASWFSPDFWKGRAKPVSSGGRGGAWFVDMEPPGMVLRHYRRGGMMARFAEKTYLFTGFEQTRSVAEFRLLGQLRSLGLPVPEAVAAIAWKYRLFWYRAAILVERIPNSVTFSDSDRLSDESLWAQLGQVIRRFHDNGLNHVDLNCDNILVTGDQLYLIDFDRCKLVPESENETDSAWKQRNLERLQRSVRKRCPGLSPSQRENLWQHLLQAYHRQPSH